MKKLIAQRPILYMGRSYERGEAVPAQDDNMVAAWLRAGSAAWSGQAGPDSGDGQKEPARDVVNAEDGQETAEEGENGEVKLLTCHLDAADLETWKKGDLEKLAEDMGVDISMAKNNAERAAILAAVEVQAPANDPDNDGGAQ